MKFNIFSKKKKDSDYASHGAANFLNPASQEIFSESKKENKALKQNNKRSQKKNNNNNNKINNNKDQSFQEAEKNKSLDEEKKIKQQENLKQENLKQEKKEKALDKKKAQEEILMASSEIEKKKGKSLGANKESKSEKKFFQEKDLQEEKKEKLKQEKKQEISKEVEEAQDTKKGDRKISRDEFKNSNILEINLVKDEINIFFDWYKNIAILVVFVFLSFLLVGEIYWALSWWQNHSNQEVSQSTDTFLELNKQTREIREKADEALVFQTKLSRANYLLDNHIYWSNFLNYLERNTLPEIKYTAFSGDLNGEYLIPAVSDNFPSIGRLAHQLKSDENTNFVTVNSGEKESEEEETVSEVNFELELKINPDLFRK